VALGNYLADQLFYYDGAASSVRLPKIYFSTCIFCRLLRENYLLFLPKGGYSIAFTGFSVV